MNSEAMNLLRPKTESLSWDRITEEDRNKIWQYLYSEYFFDKTPRYVEHISSFGAMEKEYKFQGPEELQHVKRMRILWTIHQLNIRFKKESYGVNMLEKVSYLNGCRDFHYIFMKMSGHVVLELLSIYCEGLLNLKREYEYSYVNESKEDFAARIKQWRLQEFDQFAGVINEIFTQFNIDVFLTRQGFMPTQEQKIIEQIYTSLLTVLSHVHWKEVNDLISLAFKEYEKKTT